MKPAVALLFSIILCCCLLSCQDTKTNIQNERAVSLYNKVVSSTFIDYDSLEYFVKELNVTAINKQPEMAAMSHIASGLLLSRRSYYQQSHQEYTAALEQLKNSTVDSIKARAYTCIGSNFKNMGKYAEALENYLKALRLFESSNKTAGMAVVYSQMAQVHQLKGEIETSKKYLRLAMQLQGDNQYSAPYLVALHTLANLYGMAGELDSALLADRQGVAISDSIGSLPLKATFLDNRANCFSEMSLYDSAEYYHRRCLEIDSASGNSKQMSDTYLNLGGMSMKQGKNVLAEAYFHYAIELAKKAHHFPVMQHAWRKIADIHSTGNNLQLALKAKDSAAAYKDSIINEKTELKISELKAVFESEQKQQTILLQQSQLSRQKIITASIILLSFLIALAAYSWYRRFKTRQQQQLEQVLYEQQLKSIIDILTAEEKERKRIAEDLHDGVGQLMTAAWLNLQAVNSLAAKENSPHSRLINTTLQLVDESCREVRAISHNMMPNALSKKGLINAIREFIQQLKTNELQVSLQAEDFVKPLPKFVESVLYRVIQECVNNVIRHSGATVLDITISQDEKGIDIMIEDNGKGFEVTGAGNQDGIGLQNIRSRVQYLGGTVEWDTSPGNGTLVAIFIPV